MAEEAAGKGRRPLRIGKYEVLSRIASGGMGSVYRARDVKLNREVALKILSHEMASRPVMLERFRREAQAALKLRHENIVAIYDFDDFNGTHYIAMELVEGEDLHALISRQGKLEPEEARQIMLQATRALDHAHRAGIVHRDIKPSNFLIARREGKLLVKLTDLGLARIVTDEETPLTREHTTVGTVDYMAPEQGKDSKAADIRSDIYSLGCTFFHMLAGVCPFPEGSIVERLYAHAQAEPPSIRVLNPRVPANFAAILGKMLAKDPRERYQTPADLLRDLQHPEKVETYMGRTERLAGLADLAAEEAAPRRGKSQRTEQEEWEDDPADRAQDEAGAADGGSDRAEEEDDFDDQSAADEHAVEEEVVASRRWGRKRFRDDEIDGGDTDEDAAEGTAEQGGRAGLQLPSWSLAAAGAAGLILVGAVLWSQLGSSGGKGKDNQAPPETPQTPVAVVEMPPGQDKQGNKAGGEDSQVETLPFPREEKTADSPFTKSAALVGPPAPELPLLFPAAGASERVTLDKQILGPFMKKSTLATPSGAAVLRVSRLARDDGFASLPEALLKSTGPTVIEIHDQGPLFVPPLPTLRARDITLRAAKGFRPLLVWDVPTRPGGEGDATPAAWLSMVGGTLTLEGIDFALRWPDSAATAPTVWFHLHDTPFEARACTFTAAGRHPGSIVLAQVEGSGKIFGTTPATTPATSDNADAAESNAAAASFTGVPLRFSNCYLRGQDLALLNTSGNTVDLLLENCLVATAEPALIRLSGAGEARHTVRLVRSTLVTGQTFLRYLPTDKKAGQRRLQVLAWDTVLARGLGATLQGDMIDLGAASAATMAWHATNCAYAGWKRLLVASDKTIPSGAIQAWRQHWQAKADGERDFADTWPPQWPGEPEGLGAAAYYTGGTPLGFRATRGTGALGCDLARLPPEPRLWLPRTYDRYPLPPMPLPEVTRAPAIPNPGDGLYHGEFVDLASTDLGELLHARLQNAAPGPRIVLHLLGKGKQTTSPIKIKGVRNLVLYCEADQTDEPLTLSANPRSLLDRGALIEAEDCRLELINVRLVLENKRLAPTPRWLLHLRGGELLLTRCYLEGPLDKLPDVYEGLIRIDPSADSEQASPFVAVQDSVLLSGKQLIDFRVAPGRFRASGSVLLAPDEALRLSSAASPDAPVHLVWERCTCAFRKPFFACSSPSALDANGAALILQANANYFVAPFADAAPQAAVLGLDELALERGWLLWQGKGNAYDARLTHFLLAPGAPPRKQTLHDWRQLWGPPAEQNPVRAEPAKTARYFTLDPLTWNLLELPPALRAASGPPAHGADLFRLGLITKKK